MDIDKLEEKTDAGRRLDVGGFVFTCPFDHLLRNISETCLRVTWESLSTVLKQYMHIPTDLSWGWMHPGETHIPGGVVPDPCQFWGLTSRSLYDFDTTQTFISIGEQLERHIPELHCAMTWRSLKWRIEPTEYDLALRLFEAMSVDEATNWHPQYILREHAYGNVPWVNIARAIYTQDQQLLDHAFREAEAQYTSIGYRTVLHGYTSSRAALGLKNNLQYPALTLK